VGVAFCDEDLEEADAALDAINKEIAKQMAGFLNRSLAVIPTLLDIFGVT
jgi:hypothetical protein